MGKYLLLWELDPTRMPVDPKERATLWGTLMARVREDIEKGVIKEWGMFVGGSSGFYVGEGSEVEISLVNQRYVPYGAFKAYPITSENQVNEMIKALSG